MRQVLMNLSILFVKSFCEKKAFIGLRSISIIFLERFLVCKLGFRWKF